VKVVALGSLPFQIVNRNAASGGFGYYLEWLYEQKLLNLLVILQ
jgi:hypothetical protein